MKQIELSVLSRDVDTVIEFLGRRALMHLNAGEETSQTESAAYKHIRENLERLAAAAVWLEVPLPPEPIESSRFPGETEDMLTDTVTQAVSSLSRSENEQREEKRKIEEALNEARAFSNLNAPFSDLDQLSYLTLRVGRLDPRRHEELKQNLTDRAVIIPLGGEGRVLAAASRKGRFALDSELKKMNFTPIAIPEGYKGIPQELLSGLEDRLKGADRELDDIKGRREKLRDDYGKNLQSLTGSYLMAGIAEQLKSRLVSTLNVYLLSGWVPADKVKFLVDELEKLTEGRIAVRAYSPD
jgi:V/A-type H+-transporting ATPase subunit I